MSDAAAPLSEQARAAYDESEANYRQTVLTALQEVEDNLATLRILSDEAKAQQAAVAAAEHSLDLSTNRYKGGVVSYLEVTTAQSTALADERAAVDILRRQDDSQRLPDQGLGRRMEFREPARGDKSNRVRKPRTASSSHDRVTPLGLTLK